MKICYSLWLILGCAVLALAGCSAPQNPNGVVSIIPAQAILLHAMASSSPTIRSAAVESAGQLDPTEAAVIVRQGLTDPSSAVKFTACIVAGKHRLQVLKPLLRQMVAHASQRVLPGVIYALARMGDTRHVSELAVLLENSDPVARANTAMVLGRLGDRSAIGLLRTDEREPIHAVRLAVTSALARLGYPRAVSSLIALSYSRYAEDHLAALNTCRSLATPVAVNVLLAGLSDPLPAGRLIAARGLGQRGSRVGEKLARHYSRSADPNLRVLAALALGWIPDGANADRLENMLQDPSQKVRIAAAAGLLHLYRLAKLAPAAPS